MANLTESYEWPDGVHEWAEDEFITGGPEGPDNVPPRQLAGRTQFLAALEMVLGNMGGMGAMEAQKTIRQRIQEGLVTVYNRGVITGCTASKAASGRKVLLAAGGVFAKGVETPYAGSQDGITVPANTVGASLVYYGYLSVGTNGALTFLRTDAGAVVPNGGIPICRITVPAGNTAGNLAKLDP